MIMSIDIYYIKNYFSKHSFMYNGLLLVIDFFFDYTYFT